MLNFHSILAGPFFMFADYQDFIAGTNYAKRAMNVAVSKVNGGGEAEGGVKGESECQSIRGKRGVDREGWKALVNRRIM